MPHGLAAGRPLLRLWDGGPLPRTYLPGPRGIFPVRCQAPAFATSCSPSAPLASRQIGTIAFDIGFSDLSYFNRTFRRAFGVTPSELRANIANSGTDS
jgi:AraC-like DNA-binding protein